MVITCTTFTNCVFVCFVHFFQLKTITSFKKLTQWYFLVETDLWWTKWHRNKFFY